MSALDIVRNGDPILRQVFGWYVTAQSMPQRPVGIKPDRILSLAEYRRRLENISG